MTDLMNKNEKGVNRFNYLKEYQFFYLITACLFIWLPYLREYTILQWKLNPLDNEIRIGVFILVVTVKII